MSRFLSGVTDQYLYFVAVDATDLASRETGLNTFTVYRSRNGGAAAAFTSPTINETDNTNMPGVYELLLDEDMTIDAGDDSQEMVFHITHAGMAPVTRVIELYRAKVTAGETLTVSSGAGNAAVTSMGANVMTAAAAAADLTTELQSGLATAAELAKVPKSDGSETWNATALASINAQADAALADYDGPTNAEMVARTLAAASYATAAALQTVDDEIATIDGNVDLVLEDTGTTLPATLATIAGYLDTEIADIRRAIGPATTTIATLASQTSFTLTAGSADDDAYAGWGCYVIDAATAVQVALGVVSAYVGSTRTVTLREDPGIFTMATSDLVVLLPGKLTDVMQADLRKVMGNAFSGASKPYDTVA